MSHFMAYVIIPKDEAKTRRKIETILTRMLAPYNENTKVKPYKQACPCVGMEARSAAREAAFAAHGTINELRASFYERADIAKLENERRAALTLLQNGDESAASTFEELEDRVQQEWNKVIEPVQKTENAAFEAHSLRNTPDKGCEDCSGSGTMTSTYNPQSKWDYWRVGGRWDGFITQNQRSSQNGFNFGDEHETVENNSVKTDELLAQGETTFKRLMPYALVDETGWHQKGEMGWFGTSSNEMDRDAWENAVRAILQKHPGDLVVSVDCHI